MHQNEDETFHVVEGEYEFLVDGSWVRGVAGETFHTNRGSVHTFRNCGEEHGQAADVCDAAAFEHFLEEISPLVDSGRHSQAGGDRGAVRDHISAAASRMMAGAGERHV